MSGEHDLATLIASMQATLHDATFVFITTRDAIDETALQPRLRFEEAEGTSYIATRDAAEAIGLAYEFPCRMITLNVHSALDAVGFLAAVTNRLAALGMGVNPVAGFYHDHLFVPEDRAEDAMIALREMAAEAAT